MFRVTPILSPCCCHVAEENRTCRDDGDWLSLMSSHLENSRELIVLRLTILMHIEALLLPGKMTK